MYIHRAIIGDRASFWLPSLPHPSTSVGPERSDTAHIEITSLTLSSVFTGYECRNERIVFKVAVQTYRTLHGDAPRYLQQFTHTADIPPRHRLRSSSSHRQTTVCSFLLSDFLLSVVAPFLSLMLVYGTIYRRKLPPHNHWSHFSSDWQCTYFVTRTRDYLFLPYIYSVVFVAAVCCLGRVL